MSYNQEWIKIDRQKRSFCARISVLKDFYTREYFDEYRQDKNEITTN